MSAKTKTRLIDAAFLTGLAVAVYGISLINIPSAFICGGLTAAAIAYLNAPEEEQSTPDEPSSER